MSLSRTLTFAILGIYASYFVTVSVALGFSIANEISLFVWLAPAITISLHFLAIAGGFLLVNDYTPYPVAPQWLFVAADLLMGVAAILAYIATGNGSSNAILAIAINATAIIGNLFCFYKSRVLLSRREPTPPPVIVVPTPPMVVAPPLQVKCCRA